MVEKAVKTYFRQGGFTVEIGEGWRAQSVIRQILIAGGLTKDHILMSMSLAEVLPSVRSLSAADKLRLIRLLAEQVDLNMEVAPLEHGRTYVISTPVFEPGAVESLLQELEAVSPH